MDGEMARSMHNMLMNGFQHLIGTENVDAINHILLSDSPQVWSTLPSSCYDAALLWAALKSNLSMVKMLLEMGANPLFSNKNSLNVLHYAACSPAVAAGECCTLLLQHGALVNCWDIHRIVTPLHCAACLGNISSVTALINSGADLNARDNRSNTPLHVASLCGNSAAASSLIMAGADFSAENENGVSALEYMVNRTPDAICAISNRLDSAITLSARDPMDVDKECNLHIDIKCVIPPVPDLSDKRKLETALLTSMVEENQCHLLKHPMCQYFLHLKWRKLFWFFFLSLIGQFGFVAFLTINILSANMICPEAVQNANFTASNEESCPISTRNASIIMLFLMCMSAIKETMNLIYSPRAYIRCAENVTQLILLIGVLLINVPSVDHSNWQRDVAAVVILIAWTSLLMHLGQHPAFGIYVRMYSTVVINMTKLMFLYGFVLVGFTISISLVTRENLSSLPRRFLVTLVMLTGEINYEEFSKNDPNSVTAHLILAAFLIMVVIVLMNLMVGLAVSDITELKESADQDRIIHQTCIIEQFERYVLSWTFSFPKWKISKYLNSEVVIAQDIITKDWDGILEIPLNNLLVTRRIPPSILKGLKKIALLKCKSHNQFNLAVSTAE